MSAVPDRSAPSAPAPSGTVTFLFTDIEGSTQRWDRTRDAMQQAVRRHDAMLRAAITAYGGHVFKTIGDAFCAAFARPEDAMAAALAAQRALAAEDFSAVDGLRVRAAIHVGTADERDDDYFGPTVNRVARLLSIGHGGQVLVSGAAAAVAGTSLPPQVSLRALGEHRLKDLARPESVYQLLAPGLRAEFPPLQSLDRFANNLPPQLTSLIGRETEIAEIVQLVAEHALVTLVGSGGIGKTRTALQIGANLLDGSGDGVWLIELAPVASGEHLPTTVAGALGLTLGDAGDALASLVAALKFKHALLIFDNCEHLVDAAASVITALIRGCPNVKILATSRKGLDIAAEHQYRLPSLALPADDDVGRLTARDLARYAGLALFVDRARAADDRFVVTDEHAPIIADICRRLDGIALAIELAAARVRILSPRQLRDRLHERFRLLTSGPRDALPRQQTLRALIDWSYDLLDDRQQRLFRRVGVFVNGFTLDAASAVAGGDDLDEFEVMDLLGALVEHSLVLTESHGDTLRYRLLESTRAYAVEKLAEAGEHDDVARRHLRHFRDCLAVLYARSEASLDTPVWIEAFETEREDLRAALDAALTRPDVVAGAELLAGIERIWGFVARENEGIARIEAFLGALPGTEPVLTAKLLSIEAALALESGRHARGRDVASRAVACARACGDVETLAWALIWLAGGCTFTGEAESARAALDEADALPGGSERLRRTSRQVRAALASETGDFETAARVLATLRSEARARGDARGEVVCAFGIAEAEFSREHLPEAIAVFREILPALRRSPDTALLAYALAVFAGCLAWDGDFAAAIEAARETISLRLARDPEAPEVAQAIRVLAFVAAMLGDVSRAAVLRGYVDATIARTGTMPSFTDQRTSARLGGMLRERLAPGDLENRIAHGAELPANAAVALALEVTVR